MTTKQYNQNNERNESDQDSLHANTTDDEFERLNDRDDSDYDNYWNQEGVFEIESDKGDEEVRNQELLLDGYWEEDEDDGDHGYEKWMDEQEKRWFEENKDKIDEYETRMCRDQALLDIVLKIVSEDNVELPDRDELILRSHLEGSEYLIIGKSDSPVHAISIDRIKSYIEMMIAELEDTKKYLNQITHQSRNAEDTKSPHPPVVLGG